MERIRLKSSWDPRGDGGTWSASRAESVKLTREGPSPCIEHGQGRPRPTPHTKPKRQSFTCTDTEILQWGDHETRFPLGKRAEKHTMGDKGGGSENQTKKLEEETP